MYGTYQIDRFCLRGGMTLPVRLAQYEEVDGAAERHVARVDAVLLHRHTTPFGGLMKKFSTI